MNSQMLRLLRGELTSAELPERIDLGEELNTVINELWERSIRDIDEGTVTERGGTLVLSEEGSLKLVNITAGDADGVDLTHEAPSGALFVGTFHTHPYEDGQTGMPFSGTVRPSFLLRGDLQQIGGGLSTMKGEETTPRYDDRRMRERALEYRERLRAAGIEEPPPDFDAVAARWKARQAAGEEAHTFKTYRFIIIVHPEDGQFRAYAPTLDGCEAKGATPEEAKERLLHALYARLTEMLSGGQTPPSDEGVEIVNVVVPATPQ